MIETKNKYVKLFSQIKENSKVGIYGTCDLGLEIKKIKNFTPRHQTCQILGYL